MIKSEYKRTNSLNSLNRSQEDAGNIAEPGKPAAPKYCEWCKDPLPGGRYDLRICKPCRSESVAMFLKKYGNNDEITGRTSAVSPILTRPQSSIPESYWPETPQTADLVKMIAKKANRRSDRDAGKKISDYFAWTVRIV